MFVNSKDGFLWRSKISLAKVRCAMRHCARFSLTNRGNCGSHIEFLSEKDSLISLILRKEVITWCPSLQKTSQLVITYKWERCELECVWGWTITEAHWLQGTSGWKEPNAMGRLNRGAEIGALWTRERQKKGLHETRGGWILRYTVFMKNWDHFFQNGTDLFPCKCAFCKDDIALEKMGIFQEQNLLTTWMKREKGVLFSLEFFIVLFFIFFFVFYLTSIGCERTHSEIWIWSMHFCFSFCQTVWQWLCRYPLAPLWTSIT